MKIAISDAGDGFVAQHFGHCPLFTIIEVDDNKLLSKEVIKNPGHQPGFLPRFLHEKQVDMIVAGGMGQRAIDIFDEFNIKVVIGVAGSIDGVIEEILRGTLGEGENLCDH